MAPTLLETPRLILRAWRLEDADAFHEIWGDPEVIWWGACESRAASRDLLEEQIAKSSAMPAGCGWWAVQTKDGDVVGNVLMQPANSISGRIEIGWHFDKRAQNQGYATEAASALARRAFEVLDDDAIIATIVPTNVASRRVAEKLGMKKGEQIEYAGYPHDVWSLERPDPRREAAALCL